MRIGLPASRAIFKARISVFYALWAFVAPLLALSLRDAYILDSKFFEITASYCLITGSFSLLAFLIFRLNDSLPQYFSGLDALDIVKAVLCGLLASYLVLFIVTRLNGIPRGAPVLHVLLLAGGLITARVMARAFASGPKAVIRHAVERETIIMIGATRLSSLYAELLRTAWPHRYNIVAVLDDRAKSIGRSMAGINILAATNHLESVIDEFVVHGLETSRVIVGSEESSLGVDALKSIRGICARRKIKLDFVPQLLALDELRITERAFEPIAAPKFDLPRYFGVKPLIDFVAALTMILCAPLALLAALTVLFDVGMPLLFWQQRIGQGGRRFLLYKFRTLRAPYDEHGRAVPEEKRISRIGRLMRQTRLDELPQVLNILVGDMSLIGPRPLLPVDQPENPITRLMVRPGITGWAQVHGGKFLTPAEKDQYDEYYVRNASFWLDLRIIWLTLRVVFRIGRHSDHEVSAASTVGFGKLGVPKKTAIPSTSAPMRQSDAGQLATASLASARRSSNG